MQGRECIRPRLQEIGTSNHRREVLKYLHTLALAGVFVVGGLLPSAALDISGAGATFPYPIYARWGSAEISTPVRLPLVFPELGGGSITVRAPLCQSRNDQGPAEQLSSTGNTSPPCVASSSCGDCIVARCLFADSGRATARPRCEAALTLRSRRRSAVVLPPLLNGCYPLTGAASIAG